MRRALILTTFLLFPTGCEQASALDGVPKGSAPPVAIRAADPVARTVDTPAKLEFFVMSKCPYGVQVEKAIAPVLDKLGGNVDFHIAFIGDKQGDQLSSMHGP